MKILFIMPNGFYARNFAGVIDALGRNGHKVLVALEAEAQEPDEMPSAATTVLRSYLSDSQDGRIEIIHLPRRSSLLWELTDRQIAALWDYSRYCLPLHQHAHRCADRAKSFLMGPMRFLSLIPERRRDRAARVVARVCAWMHEILPPRRGVLRDIRAYDPDVVLITPLVDLGSRQHDYVKICRRLRIPIGCCVASWDNLTNKGLIKAPPDRMFVWNAAQKAEAVTLHGMPETRVVITGAQIFDHWFEAKPTLSRIEFCSKTGLDPSKLILLYTASSLFICNNELDFVLKWIQTLRGCEDVRLREAGILIRPHPKATRIASQWDHAGLKQFKQVVVFPNSTELSLARESRDDYYNSLHHSAAVVGINTSAMVEASIVGRRSFTILLDELRAGQDEMIHFHHLTRNGLLGRARTFDEHIAQLRCALDARDNRTKDFVELFLRPYGIEQPATPVFVAEVEEMEGMPVEGLSACTRLNWLQLPVLLPVVAALTLISWLSSSLQLARSQVGNLLRWTGLLSQRQNIASALDKNAEHNVAIGRPGSTDQLRNSIP